MFKAEIVLPLSGVALVALGIYLVTQTTLRLFGSACIALGISVLLFGANQGKLGLYLLLASLALFGLGIVFETNWLLQSP